MSELKSALRSFERALTIIEALVARDPTNAGWQNDAKETRAAVERLRGKSK